MKYKLSRIISIPHLYVSLLHFLPFPMVFMDIRSTYILLLLDKSRQQILCMKYKSRTLSFQQRNNLPSTQHPSVTAGVD